MKFAIRIVALGVFLLAFAGESSSFTYKLHFSFTGTSSSQYLGYYGSVANAGDIDQDGVNDVVAGAYNGRYVVVLSGATGSRIHMISGSYSYFGMSVGGGGDVDADGVPDIVVGCYASYRVEVYSGADLAKQKSTVLYSFTNSYIGYLGVIIPGDINQDGYADILCGGYSSYGPRLYSGKDGSLLSAMTCPTDVSNYSSYFGMSVGVAGDVNKDGYPDMLLGHYYAYSSYSYEGAVHVFSGKDYTRIYTRLGGYYYDYLGFSVAKVKIGDADGDGYDDFAAGAYGGPSQTYAGYVRVYSGKTGNVISTHNGKNSSEYMGYYNSVSGIGDIDGDGLGDVVAGGYYGYNSNYVQAGVVRAYSPKNNKELIEMGGTNAYDYYGWGVAGMGDLNGDGMGDLAVSSPGSNSYAGTIFVYVTPAPSGTVVIEGGLMATAITDVTLYMTWKAGDPKATVTQMRVREAGGTWGSWVSVASSLAFTLSDGEGQKTVEAQFKDSAGLTSKIQSDTIFLDQSPPTGYIRVAGGAVWTNQTVAPVNFYFTDSISAVQSVRLRQKGGTWGAWSTNPDTGSVNLSGADGIKVVEAQARDFAGNESAVVEDSVSLDTQPPAMGSIVLDSGAPYSKDWTVHAVFSAADNPGGSGIADMKLRRFDEINWRPWQPFATELDLTLNAGEGTRGFFVVFRDTAGNQSREFYDSVVIDVSPPTVIEMSVSSQYPYFVAGEMILVKVFARDNDDGTGISVLRGTFDGGATYTDWVPYSTVGTEILSPARTGFQNLRVQLRDNAENQSGLSEPVTVYLLTALPPYLGMSGSFNGTMSDANDLDAIALDLLGGDVVTPKLKAKSAVKGQALPIVVSLLRPDGTMARVALGEAITIPADGAGRYLFEVTQTGPGKGPGSYGLSVSVKRPKKLISYARTLAPNSDGEVEFVFWGSEGTLFNAGLRGGSVMPQTVEVRGPEGAVPFFAEGVPGSVKLTAVFEQRVGLYRFVVPANGPVTMTMKNAP
ncbi:MAG: FG-GAP-like repeat-containing protein, partial [Planctomycetes bacterium]|nr:FG-GAP-like repeat-containing protein [Planctomycetota bacterium]